MVSAGKQNGGKRSCTSVGQQHARAQARTTIQLHFSNLVTLTDAKAPLGAQEQAC